MAIANTWHRGSTFYAKLPTISNTWELLKSDAPLWNNARQNSSSISYRTGSSSDAGPLEFQIAERALKHGQMFAHSIVSITEGLVYAQQTSPYLSSKIDDLIMLTTSIGVPEKKITATAKELTDEIMNLTRTLYTKNFSNGIDTKEFRGYAPILFGLLGLIAGGTFGCGIDYAGERLRWYGSKNNQLNRRRF